MAIQRFPSVTIYTGPDGGIFVHAVEAPSGYVRRNLAELFPDGPIGRTRRGSIVRFQSYRAGRDMGRRMGKSCYAVGGTR